MADDPEILLEGKHLRFLRRSGWEYVEHRTAPEAAMVVALTPQNAIVLTEELRPALNAWVIALPSGLIGDEGPEDAADAARRELAEETGHEAREFRRLFRGPGSAGQSSELVTFFLATDARATRAQAAHDRGKIRVHVVPIAELPEWARRREGEGAVVDPKIWAGLYLAGLESDRAGASPAPTAPSGRSSRRPSRAPRGRSRSSRPSTRRRSRPPPRSGR